MMGDLVPLRAIAIGCTDSAAAQGIKYSYPREAELWRAMRCPLGKNGTEYFHSLPIFSQFFPDSRSVLSEESPRGRKFLLPAPFCPILSHPVFTSCSRMTQGPSHRTGIHEGTVGSNSHTKVWYGSAMRLGKRQVSSKYPYAIALAGLSGR